MYINRIKKARYMIFGHIQLFIGVVFTLIGIFGIWEIAVEFEKVKTFWEGFLFFGVIGVASLFFGIRNKVLMNSCNIFDEAFKKDGDGIVDIKEISLRSGMEEAVILKRLQLLMKKQCLINVTVNFDKAQPVIVLEDNNAALFRKKSSKGHTMAYCPNCGASCMVKEGMVAKCQFCGGYIKGNSRN